MSNAWVLAAIWFAMLGSGLIAGVFFAFSTFVMTALARIVPASAIAAMQSINLVVINPLFMLAFMGTALASVGLGVVSCAQWSSPGSGWLLAASLLYLVGCFGVTLAFNVPLNNALAGLDPAAETSVAAWKEYVRVWTLWNHLRATASLLACAGFVLAPMACRVAV